MAKFLGVISNRYNHPSDNVLLEFTDLDMLANFLYHETQNLYNDFQRKSEVITAQELNLTQNLNQITDIYNYNRFLQMTTSEMENEMNEITCWLSNLERTIDCLASIPANMSGCKCTANPERSSILQKIVKLSEDCMNIDKQLTQVTEEEDCASVNCPCDLTKTLVPFLDLHTQILEKIDQKMDKVTDQLKEVDGLFTNAYKRSIGACYHKPRHDLNSSSYC